MKNTIIPIAAMAALLAVGSANAATTLTYDFAGGSAAAVTVGGDATGSDASWGAFDNGTSGKTGFSGSSNTAYARADATGGTDKTKGDTLAEAITNKAYLSMTITAGASDITLTDIAWSYKGTNVTAAKEFTTYLLTESKGFTAADAVGSLMLTSDAEAIANEYPGVKILAGQSEEIRFYLSDKDNNNNNIHRLDKIVITATVPEPSSAALLGLGGLALMLRRRK